MLATVGVLLQSGSGRVCREFCAIALLQIFAFRFLQIQAAITFNVKQLKAQRSLAFAMFGLYNQKRVLLPI